MSKQYLKRIWSPQTSSKLLPHKGYRYDEGTWFAELLNHSWRSFTVIKREIGEQNEIIEYLCEDEYPRLPKNCLWIEEFMFDSVPLQGSQCGWTVTDWCIEEVPLPFLPSSLPSSLPEPVLSCPPPKQSLLEKQQHSQQSKPSPQANRQQRKSVSTAPLAHSKPKGRVKKPNKSSEPSLNQFSSNQDPHAQPKQPNSSKRAKHHPQSEATAGPLPIQQWTPLQTLLQGPLPLKQQVSVSEDPKGKKQNSPRPRVNHPKQLKKKKTTLSESSISVQKPSIVIM